MNESKSTSDTQVPVGSPVVNETRLEATNSPIGNASQVVNSPGAVVSQTITQVQSRTNSPAIMLGGFALLTTQAFVSAGRSYGAINIFVSGGAWAVIVFGFFSWVEAALTDETKFEIAVWLVGVKVGEKVEPWPDTFAKVFDKVFGKKHLSWRCLGRSAVVSFAMVSVLLLVDLPHDLRRNSICALIPVVALLNIAPDYASLLKSRFLLQKMKSCGGWIGSLLLVTADTYVTLLVSSVALILCTIFLSGATYDLLEFFHGNPEVYTRDMSYYAATRYTHQLYEGGQWVISMLHTPLQGWLMLFRLKPLLDPSVTSTAGRGMVLYPAFFTSIWLWLYAGSGFLLKFAQRFDIGFQWFNRKFDIEKKPLSAIGLVAGALVAVVYWGFAVGAYLVKK